MTTPDATPPQAMTDEQKIAYLAEKVMGWNYVECEMCYDSCIEGHGVWTNKLTQEMFEGVDCWCQTPLSRGLRIFADETWNPLTDWNHWRQVEEKVMKDDGLFNTFLQSDEFVHEGVAQMAEYLEANLPTRVDALIAAYQSLNA